MTTTQVLLSLGSIAVTVVVALITSRSANRASDSTRDVARLATLLDGLEAEVARLQGRVDHLETEREKDRRQHEMEQAASRAQFRRLAVFTRHLIRTLSENGIQVDPPEDLVGHL